MNSYKEITTRDEFSKFLNIPIQFMTNILYGKGTENCYHTFEIEKKSGGKRIINAPNKALKSIQKSLAIELERHQLKIWKENGIKPNISHAFEKEKNIITNARVHRNKKFVLNLDLENFFDSFHFGRVKGFFEKNKDFKVPKEIALIIAQLTCYKGALPQGAPTSPIITNLICKILDIRILKLAKKYKVDYTRYADDLTFSTNKKNFPDFKEEFLEELAKEINNAGFVINEKKTRLQYKNSKQTVTGLVVNKKINVDNEYYRQTRALAHTLYKREDIKINGERANIKNVEGRFAFINQIDWENNNIINTKKDFSNLNGREKQYKKFLFFKYFFENNKPLIVCEGKTDIKYILAALKNLYSEYPNLISKRNDGTFEYKVSFLKRTKRMRFFLDINLDGASALKKIYEYYTPGKSLNDPYPNYMKYFKRISKGSPKNPVFLLFDNEMMENSKKPLSGFLNKIKINSQKKNELKTNLKVNVVENLFLITNPLNNSKKECEIEDLFDQNLLSVEIKGKTFEPNAKKFNNEKNYSKEVFSNYVFKNYNNIDFNNFRPILNNIDTEVRRFNK